MHELARPLTWRGAQKLPVAQRCAVARSERRLFERELVHALITALERAAVAGHHSSEGLAGPAGDFHNLLGARLAELMEAKPAVADGGGLYVVSEFSNGNAYLNQDDLDSINRVMMPLGVEAQMVSLNWGNVDGNIEFDCFPAPVG